MTLVMLEEAARDLVVKKRKVEELRKKALALQTEAENAHVEWENARKWVADAEHKVLEAASQIQVKGQ